MPKRTTVSPAITRVHKLFHIRTVVNDAPKYLKKGELGVTQEQIGQILVDRKLSKASILESQNKLKRARDHALNASLLGFFVPIRQGRKFQYVRSAIAEQLSKYSFAQACPYDLHESAVLVDRLMKLKLTNAYDQRHFYSKFHTRLCLSILTALKYQPLHISEIHYLLGQFEDLATNPPKRQELLDIFAK